MPDLIWLNGVANSGKTTLAVALQGELDDVYLWASIDRFAGMLPARSFGSRDIYVEHLEAVVRGFHRSIRALVDAGNSVIVDHVLRDPNWLAECIELFQGCRVLFVGVHCHPDVLIERARAREASLGQPGRQLQTTHAHATYDVEVDTSEESSEECVARVLRAHRNPPVPSAFERLAGVGV